MYNAANQLTTARADNDGIVWRYIHDNNGNLLRQVPGGTDPAEGETRYSYDAANRLIKVELHTGGSYTLLSEATYNGDGERVALTTYALGISQTVSYVVGQGGELLVADDGDTQTIYLYGQSQIAEYSAEWHYPLRDSSSSVRQTVAEDGSLTSSQTYKPFGDTLQENGTYESLFGFMGAQVDRLSGLLYIGGRYYDPATGRYLTLDRNARNPYAPSQGPELWLLLPFVGIVLAWKRRKDGPWRMLVLVCVVGVGMSLVSCGGSNPFETPKPRPPLSPLKEVSIDTSNIEWVDEMDWDKWIQYPNSCGPAALYMFLKAEGKPVDYPTLIDQLKSERPGGYDGYCCTRGQGFHPDIPTPTPAPDNWCNSVCTSAETLADVARKYYGLNISSGDNWTRERVYERINAGHAVLVLARVDMSTNQGGHFVVITGFKNQGQAITIYDSYPSEDLWGPSGYHASELTPEQKKEWREIRRDAGVNREVDWYTFDDSWASNLDSQDPHHLGGPHVRWAMAVVNSISGSSPSDISY